MLEYPKESYEVSFFTATRAVAALQDMDWKEWTVDEVAKWLDYWTGGELKEWARPWAITAVMARDGGSNPVEGGTPQSDFKPGAVVRSPVSVGAEFTFDEGFAREAHGTMWECALEVGHRIFYGRGSNKSEALLRATYEYHRCEQLTDERPL